MMDPKGEISDSVSLAYQRETREFRWVCIWAGLAMICGLGILGVRLWNQRRIAELLAGGADTKEVMSQAKVAANWMAGFGFPSFAFLICLLISMVSWLLAIRGRRKVQEGAGFQAGKHRSP
jgi:hypothetical protein